MEYNKHVLNANITYKRKKMLYGFYRPLIEICFSHKQKKTFGGDFKLLRWLNHDHIGYLNFKLILIKQKMNC